jgi:NlpC/P60 family putative phage cell wall peptidase
MATRAQVVAEARAWIGTPCHHHAGLKGVGTDCGGLVRGVGAALGLDPAGWQEIEERFRGYPKRPVGGIVRAGLNLYADPIPVGIAQPGDILLMQFDLDNEPQHVGVLTDFNGRPGLIHAYIAARKVAEHGIDATWRRRIVGAYRYRGIE